MTRPSLLLMPTIPKPLHGIAPRTVLGDAWWNRKRQEAYAKAGFCCEACGVPKAQARYHKWLEAHENYDIDYARGTMTFVELVALCHACHNYIHSGRLLMLAESCEISEEKAQGIIEHGDAIVRANGLKREPVPSIVAPWEAWRMIYEGQAYGPSSKNQAAWERGEWRRWHPPRVSRKPKGS